MKTFIFSISIFFFTVRIFGQQNADCIDAINVCIGQIEFVSPTGEGNYLDFSSGSGTFSSCLFAEKNSTFFKFTASVNGSLSFVIAPSNSADDYDWAVFDITQEGCNNLGNHVISANYSSSNGITGPNGFGTDSCAGPSDTRFSPTIPCIAGNQYLIYASNYSASGDTATIDFSNSSIMLINTGNNTFSIDTCTDNGIELFIPNSNPLWSTGETTNSIVAPVSGLYFVDYTNYCGYYSTDSFHVNLNQIPHVPLLPNDTGFCSADTVTIHSFNSYSSYNWSTGDTTDSLTIFHSGEYFLHADDIMGCTHNDTIIVYFSSDLANPSICKASFDTVNQGINLYYETYPIGMPIVQYEIFKKTNSIGSYVSVATQTPNNAGFYFDAGANTTENAEYYIIATDTCGNTPSTIPDTTRSIFLNAQYVDYNGAELTWNYYHGPEPNAYLVYYGTSPSNLTLFETVLPTTHVSVVSLLQQNMYFLVEAHFASPCGGIETALSNLVYFPVGINEQSFPKCSVNPTVVENSVKINCVEEYNTVQFFDLSGRMVFETSNKSGIIDISELMPGMYTLRIIGEQQQETVKIIKL